MRLYLDANTIIYAIEGVSPSREAILRRVSMAEAAPGGTILTSRLSRLECRIKPLRESNQALLATYEKFFTEGLLRLVEINSAVVERATTLRVQYGMKTPDAIHIATAIEEHADLFLTGDQQLARCRELNIEIL